jgi:hypothetical protein
VPRAPIRRGGTLGFRRTEFYKHTRAARSVADLSEGNNLNVCTARSEAPAEPFLDWDGTSYDHVITFSEYPVGTSSPVYAFDDLTVSFSPDSFITRDAANTEEPVLSGEPIFYGPINILFSRPVRGVAIQCGYFDGVGVMGIIFYSAAGVEIARRTNSVIGLETIGSQATRSKVSKVSSEITADDPTGYALGTIYIKK